MLNELSEILPRMNYNISEMVFLPKHGNCDKTCNV
jgi:hypothetical protein